MGRPIPSHRGFTGAVLPPLDLLEPLIEKTDSHWYWDGDVTEFDRIDRVSTFRWRPPNERIATFVVVRVLWVYQTNTSTVEKLRLHNTCGLMWCVNPAHIALHRPNGPVTVPPGTLQRDGVGVKLMAANSRVHIVSVDTNYAVCGWVVKSAFASVLDGEPVTCPDCLATWRLRGYELVEVK